MFNSSRLNFGGGAIAINGNNNSNRLRYSIRETKEINCINSNNNINNNINSNSSSNSTTNITIRSCRSNLHDVNSNSNNNNNGSNVSLTIENTKLRKSTAINMNSSSITKPLELNMAHLEEIVRQHQKEQTQRYTELNPIQETSESGRQEEKKNTNYITDLKQRSYFNKKIPTINNIITKSLASFNQTTTESTSPPKLTSTSIHSSSNNAFKYRITNPSITNSNYNSYNTETSSTSSTLLTSLSSTITPISNISTKPPYISKYSSITNNNTNTNSTFSKYMSNFNNNNNSFKKTLVNCNTTTNMSFNKGNTMIKGIDSNKNEIESTRNVQTNGSNAGYVKNRGCIGFKTLNMLNMSYSTTNYDKIKNNDYCIQYPKGMKQK
jgi:hypothetical protein